MEPEVCQGDEFECSECDYKSYSEFKIQEHSSIHSSNKEGSRLYMDENNDTIQESTLKPCVQYNYENKNVSGSEYKNTALNVKKEPDFNENLHYENIQDNKDWFSEIEIENLPTDQDDSNLLPLQITCHNNMQQNLPILSLDKIKTESSNLDDEMITESESNTQADWEGSYVFTIEGIFPASSSSDCIDQLNNQNKPKRKPRKQNFKNQKSCSESDERYFEDFFVVKQVVCNKTITDCIICKICNFSCCEIKESHDHARMHCKELKISNTLIANSIIATNYDFFVCLLCHKRIIKREYIQIHIQSHDVKQISNCIIDIKIIKNDKGKSEALHCCTICPFACPIYLTLYLHVRTHTPQEIDEVDKIKFNKILSNQCTGDFIKEQNSEMLENICHCGGPNIWSARSKKYIEVEIDHHISYVPDGWLRKSLQTKSEYKKGLCSIYYISPFGDLLGSKVNVKNYMKSLESKGIMLSVNIEEFDFTVPSHHLPSNVPSQISKTRKWSETPKIEIQINNNGKYIPEGWERKVYKITRGPWKGLYKVNFITPSGKILTNKARVRDYIKKIESEGTPISINVEDLDFTTSSHNLPKEMEIYNKKRRKICFNKECKGCKLKGCGGRKSMCKKVKSAYTKIYHIELDNTGIYVPEGWQRCVYTIARGPSKGLYKICYVSPYNKAIGKLKDMRQYLASLERKGTPSAVNLQKLNFRLPDHLKKN